MDSWHSKGISGCVGNCQHQIDECTLQFEVVYQIVLPNNLVHVKNFFF